jgi:ubiquinone biosynthesis protein
VIDLTALPQFTRNAKRFREIVTILAKYGLADRFSSINPDFIQGLLKTVDGTRLADLSHEERIRLALTDLGVTFIKFGQMLSTRPDLVGPELAAELTKLQSSTPADSPEKIKEIIESEMGAPPEKLFHEFNYTPLASASIGQVHQAYLPSGEKVAIKVQHHNIEQTVINDLEILIAMSELAEAPDSAVRLFQPVAVAKEFRRNLLREMDFMRERRNMETFIQNFAKHPKVKFAKPYAEYSSRRVLTMDMLEGTPLNETDRIQGGGYQLKELAVTGANIYLDMIFRDGFYHADPHPGNILLMEGQTIGLLDCGMVGRIDEQTRDDFEMVLIAAVNGDHDLITDYVVRIGSVPPDLDKDALQSELGDFLSEYTSQSISEFDLSGALTGITDVIRRFRILLPPNISMILKVLVMLEGTSQLLNPDFNLAELLRPFHVKAIRRRFSPQRILSKMQRRISDWDRLIDSFPRNITDIMDNIRQGRVDINLEHHRLDPVVNRLVYGILVASLYLGSALLWSMNVKPLIYGVPIFGALGTVTAIALGLRLIRAIHKSGTLTQKKK